METALNRFRAAGTQVMGVSVDSVYSHANWGRGLGGVSFPLLADFQPKGAAAAALGHYMADAGITDRATVVVDREGIVRYSVGVTPAGVRSADELVGVCEGIGGGALAAGNALPTGTRLFVKSKCGASRAAQLAVENLRLSDVIEIANVTNDTAAAADLASAAGNDKAPCLVLDGKTLQESVVITQTLADRVAPLA